MSVYSLHSSYCFECCNFEVSFLPHSHNVMEKVNGCHRNMDLVMSHDVYDGNGKLGSCIITSPVCCLRIFSGTVAFLS